LAAGERLAGSPLFRFHHRVKLIFSSLFSFNRVITKCCVLIKFHLRGVYPESDLTMRVGDSDSGTSYHNAWGILALRNPPKGIQSDQFFPQHQHPKEAGTGHLFSWHPMTEEEE
ncbi:MAG: hypothetical protein V3S64_09920, partial [bacterium]